MSYNGIGNAYQNMGQWSEAAQYLRRARVIFAQTGDELHHVFANNNLGEIARSQGRLDDALTFYQEALHSLEQLGGSQYAIGVLHMNLGATFVRHHAIDTARQHLQTARDYFAAVNARDFLPELYRYFAEAALIAQDVAEAADQGQQALDLARELAMRGEEGNSLRVLGEIAQASDQLDLAAQRLTESLAVLEEVGHEYEAARSRLALAEVYIAQQKPEQALVMLAQCVPVFERLDAQLALAAARDLRAQAGGS